MLVWYRLQKNLIIEKTFLWKWNSVTTLPGKIVTQISIAVFLRILATWFVLHIIQPSILTPRVEQYSLLSCSTVLYILFPPHPLLPESPMATTPSLSSSSGLGLPGLHHDTFITPFFGPKTVKTHCTVHCTWRHRRGDVTSNPEWLWIAQYCQVQTECRDVWLAWDTSFFSTSLYLGKAVLVYLVTHLGIHGLL